MSKYNSVTSSLKQICSECDYYNTDGCTKEKCSIGFSQEVIKVAEDSSVQSIEGGYKLIPCGDMKYYRQELIADSIAEVCKLCSECRENHNESCVISLCRHSLENTVLKENMVYPGSVLMYIVGVSKQNPEFAEMLMSRYKK